MNKLAKNLNTRKVHPSFQKFAVPLETTDKDLPLKKQALKNYKMNYCFLK